jgi:predicted nucleic acid-binding Zn ribbon protein
VSSDEPEVEPADIPPASTGSTSDEGVEHDPDGLDLARALTRAVARLGGTPAKRRSKGFRRTNEKGRVSGAHPDERDPQTLDATLRRLVGDHGWDLSLRVHGVFGRWPQIVGEEIAQHCEPESFADGKLVVRTDSTAWATQLRLLAPTLVRRLNEELGHGTVMLIEVLGPHAPTWKKGRRSIRGARGPRDTYG